MRKLVSLLTALLSVAYCCSAQSQLPADTAKEYSLLWKISGNNMNHPSFLFGTIHLICKDDFIWTAALRNSLKQSRELCFEMDMDDPSVMIAAATAMISTEGKPLKDYFSAEEYGVVEQFVKDSLGMSMSLLQQMKPAALHLLFAAKTAPCIAPESAETLIMSAAKKLKLEITGLEEPTEQLRLFDQLHADSLVKEIVDMSKDFSQERSKYQQMLGAYKKQDLPLLYQLIEDANLSGEDMDSFLHARNRRWISRMEGRMEQRPVFFAVGAGHLWGEYGIIQLLRQAGYTVECIK